MQLKKSIISNVKKKYIIYDVHKAIREHILSNLNGVNFDESLKDLFITNSMLTKGNYEKELNEYMCSNNYTIPCAPDFIKYPNTVTKERLKQSYSIAYEELLENNLDIMEQTKETMLTIISRKRKDCHRCDFLGVDSMNLNPIKSLAYMEIEGIQNDKLEGLLLLVKYVSNVSDIVRSGISGKIKEEELDTLEDILNATDTQDQ